MSSYYLPLLTPPALDAPTGLTLTAVPGYLIVSLTHPIQSTARFAFVEITLTSGDYSNPILVTIPANRTSVAIPTAFSAPVWAQAWEADSFGDLSALTAEVGPVTTEGSAVTLVPMTVYDPTSGLWTVLVDGDGNVIMVTP